MENPPLPSSLPSEAIRGVVSRHGFRHLVYPLAYLVSILFVLLTLAFLEFNSLLGEDGLVFGMTEE